MTIGTALVIIAVLYFIDKHNLWKKASIVAAILAIIFGAGLLVRNKYDKWQTARAEQAEQKEIEKQWQPVKESEPQNSEHGPWEKYAKAQSSTTQQGRYTVDDIAACPPNGYKFVDNVGCNDSPKTLPRDYFNNSDVNTKFACYNTETGKLTPDFFEQFGGKMRECAKEQVMVTKK